MTRPIKSLERAWRRLAAVPSPSSSNKPTVRQEWGGKGGVLHKTTNRVGLPEGSKALVRKVFVAKESAAGDKVFRSIERAFAVAPTSKRVVEDILALPMVLDRIIEHKGTVVEDEALRHGRRLAKHKTWESLKPNKAPLKNKPRSFQRQRAAGRHAAAEQQQRHNSRRQQQQRGRWRRKYATEGQILGFNYPGLPPLPKPSKRGRSSAQRAPGETR